MKKWCTINQVEEHLRENNSEGAYSLAVPTAALFKKLYGRFPKMGMSGQQAEFAQEVFEALPELPDL